MLAAIFSALAIATIAAAFLSGFMNRLWVDGTRADLWAEADRHNLRYYHDRLLRQYPLLWPLFPLAAWIAIARHRRAGLLALCVFAVPLLAHSIVAAKAERYLYYAMPMFFALYGIAIGTALPSVRGWLASLVPSGRTAFIRAFDLGAGLVLAMIVAYPLLLRPGLLFAVREIRQGDAPWVGWGRPSGNPDWLAAGDSLRHLLDVSEVVLGSDEVAAYYGLGRIDYLVRRAATPERGVLPEFTPYRRVVPIVTTPQSLGRIAECGSTGLLFVERKYTNREWTGIPPLLPYLEANFIRVPVPEPWALLVYRWEHTASPSSLVDDVDGAGCDGLPHRQNRPGRER
jgi:MFS family permease